jgi:class 3 adenylate cyclase
MAAGGILWEVNQPAVHAKEMVQFGIDAVLGLERVNRELKQKLRIRVGVHEGGPIVAGIIGTKKPNFEILGPAIGMAQQMEHLGVPMKVHISRSVYELIYGGSFDVKERGTVNTKFGDVISYLVDPHGSPI